MNMEEKDKLRSLFQEIKLDEPSAAFESMLMKQVHIVVEKKRKKQKAGTIISIFMAITGMLAIPTLILWYLGFTLADTEIKLTIPTLNFDPYVVSIACTTLLLLISDTLIRKRIWEKKHKD